MVKIKSCAFFFALAILGFGCKDKGSLAPEATSSIGVQSLFAVNDRDSVTLGWPVPLGGTPAEYEIHRSTNQSFNPSGSTYIATVSGGATRFVDRAVTTGSLYYYRVVPVERLSNGERKTDRASNVAIGRPYDYSNIGAISYDEHIQPLFISTCAVHGCHVGYDDDLDKRFGLAKTQHGGEFSLKSWDELFQGSKDGAVIIPYKAQKSDLIYHVNYDTLVAPAAEPHMPLEGFNLPADQIQTLMRWVDEGAPNQQGAIAYTYTPRGRVLAVNASEDLLAVVDIESNLLIRYVNVGRQADPSFMFGSPHHVKVDRQGRYFYATLINSQQVWKFSASTYEFLGRVDVPFEPADVVPSAGGDTVYVTSYSSIPGRVTLIDTRTMQVLSTIIMSNTSKPHGAVLSHDGTKLYVTNLGSGNITMINTADNAQTLIALDTTGNPFTSNVNPYLADLSPDDRYMMVTDYNQTAQNVYFYDLVADPTRPTRVIPIGGRSIHVAFTPDGSEAWVCNFNQNSVNIINMADFSITTIPDVGRQPHAVIFTEDGSTAFITTENYLTPDPPHHPSAGSTGASYMAVIDVATRTIVQRIEMGAFGQGETLLP